MDNRHKSLFRWHKSRWWSHAVLTVSMVAASAHGRLATAQDFPDFGSDVPPNPGLDAASDLVDDPFSLPISAPQVETLSDPEGAPPPAPRSKKLPRNGGVNWRGLREAGIDINSRRYQEFGVDDSNNPLNAPQQQGRVADFTKQENATTTTYTRRELTEDERRHIVAAMQQADELVSTGENAFRRGEMAIGQYTQTLELSLKMKGVAAEILDDPQTVARALDVQAALLRSAGRQIASLDQPGGERWKAEVLLTEVLLADTAMKSATLRRDAEQLARAKAAKSAAAARLFAQRMNDYGIGMSTLQEVTQAARHLVPAASTDLSPGEAANLERAFAAYGELLRSAEDATAAWHTSKAGMGTDELASLFFNDGRLHDLDELGPDGTGLGPDDAFADVRDYDDLTAQSATRPAPLEHGDVIPSEFDTTAGTAGVGRADRLLATQAEVLGLSGQVAERQGYGGFAQNAYSESFAASNALYQTRLGMYKNGTAGLGDVLDAWMAGQGVRQHWGQAGYQPRDEWTALQREALSDLENLAGDGHDRRGSGIAELEMLSSLGAFEQLSDLRTSLAQEAAERAAAAGSPTPAVTTESFQRVQSFVPDDNLRLDVPN